MKKIATYVWKKLFLILIITFVLSTPKMFSQEINIQKEQGIDELTSKYVHANQKIKAITGFRVQIFFDSGNNSRQAAEATQTRFRSRHPNVPSYLTFREPNFRIRVGDFRTRHEARGFMRQIQADYPNAFVIKDEINLMTPFSNFYDKNSENEQNENE